MLLSRLKYSNKIRVLFVPVFLVFSVGLLFIYLKVARILASEHEERLKRTAELTLHNLDLTAQEMRKIAHLFRTNRTLIEYYSDVNLRGGSKSALRGFLAPYLHDIDIDFIRLFDEKGRPICDIDARYANDSLVHSLGKDLPGDTVYGFSESREIVEVVSTAPLFREERGKGHERIVGFMSVGKYVSSEYLAGLKEVSGNEIMLVRDSKILVSSLDKDKIFLPSAGKALIGSQAYSIRGMPVKDLYGESLISMTVAISDEPLMTSIKTLRALMSLILLPSVVLFMVLSHIFERVLVTPLKEIIRFISGIASGKFDGLLAVSTRDEISFLSEHLLVMQEKLKEGQDLMQQYAADLQKAVHERTRELKDAEAQLLRSQRLEVLGQLTSGVAHEVRNPLNAIMALADVLALEIGDNLEMKSYLEHLRAQVLRLSSLMNELLDLGKPIDASQMKPESLVGICSLAIDAWRHTALGKDVPLCFTVLPDGRDSTILVYSDKMQQVLINLFDNAAQHSPQGSGIELNMVSGNGHAVISVIDQGSGIPPKVLPRVFEMFFTTRRGGTGLGLGIVKNIVEMHGGGIRVFNNDPPPGCTFEITLPSCGEETA